MRPTADEKSWQAVMMSTSGLLVCSDAHSTKRVTCSNLEKQKDALQKRDPPNGSIDNKQHKKCHHFIRLSLFAISVTEVIAKGQYSTLTTVELSPDYRTQWRLYKRCATKTRRLQVCHPLGG